jgi:hypothetical protein
MRIGWVQSRPDVHATILTLCRFSVRNKETGKNYVRGTTKSKYRGIRHWRQITGREYWVGFRVRRDPSRIDAKHGDHFLQADFSLPILIATWSSFVL